MRSVGALVAGVALLVLALVLAVRPVSSVAPGVPVVSVPSPYGPPPTGLP